MVDVMNQKPIVDVGLHQFLSAMVDSYSIQLWNWILLLLMNLCDYNFGNIAASVLCTDVRIKQL
ncbi:hypothetical protein Bca4012_063044 [Brassica carinata]